MNKKNFVQIADKKIGPDQPVFIAAEIGINHNGSLDMVKKLIDVAVEAGADAVKFQKRTVPIVYTKEELERPREVPESIILNALRRRVLPEEAVRRLKSDISNTTNGDLKYALELTEEEYRTIDRYCQEKNILWLASCWNEESVDFMDRFNLPCYKIASACLTDDGLLKHTRGKGKPIILSTGMSTMEEIEHAVKVLGADDLIILHCISTYPAQNKELNLKIIQTLQNRFPSVPIGYSGHEVGLPPSLIAVVLGAKLVERHLTLDRAMWGCDQAASVEPQGLKRLVRDIRMWEEVKGDGVKRLLDSEIPIMNKLRRKK